MDENTVEALFAGQPVGNEWLPLAAFIDDVRAAADAPSPALSPQLAAFMVGGFSTDNGDLLATAASKAPGPAPQESGLPKWRMRKMKINKLVAGMSLATKIALGMGVAVAGVGSAAATGVLPVRPHDSHSHTTVSEPVHTGTGGDTHEPTTTVVGSTGGTGGDKNGPGVHDGPGGTTTGGTTTGDTGGTGGSTGTTGGGTGDTTGGTVTPPPGGTTGGTGGDTTGGTTGGTTEPPTTQPGGDHHEPPPTTVPVTEPPTTAPPTTQPEHHVPQSITLTCTAYPTEHAINCHWSGIPTGAKRLVLLRIASGQPGRVPLNTDNVSRVDFTDTTVSSRTGYGYRIDALNADGSVLATSNLVTIQVVF